MAAPMPDFEMPDEASEARRGRARLPRGPRARRLVAIGVTAVVLATLAIVGVPALVEQQRGRDAVAIVERYAASVAEGDVDAVVAASPPDASEASGALLRTGALTPTVAFAVDDIELVAVDGARAVVRIDHTIGLDAGRAEVVVVDSGDGWGIVEGLLGIADLPFAHAAALGAPGEAGPVWLLPGRYDVPPAPLGAFEVRGEPYVVAPGERAEVVVDAGPSQSSTLVGYDAVDDFLDSYRADCGAACPLEIGDDTDVPATLTWDLDFEARTGTMQAMITTTVEEQTASGQIVARSVLTTVAFDVVIADDLQSLTVTPADPVAAP